MLSIPVKRSYKTVYGDSFNGYDMREGQLFGKLYTENLTSDSLPELTPRSKRYTVIQNTQQYSPNGIGANDRFYRMLGNSFEYDGNIVGACTLGENIRRRFVNFGKYIVILPDKQYYNSESGVFGSLEASVSVSLANAEFRDGTLNGASAGVNTIHYEGVIWQTYGLGVGDGLTVKYKMTPNGSERTITATVREIAVGELRFDADSFEGLTPANITYIGRDVPDIDWICACDDRLWGCRGNKIFCSAPGDPFNWNSSQCWSAEIRREGDFTGCFAYNGKPLFFKENSIWQIYGSKPGNYQVSAEYSVLGVMNGCADSLAAVDGKVYYISRAGIVRYGSRPELISQALGDTVISGGVGASDGKKYYLSTASGLFVYDSESGKWMREDMITVSSAVYFNGVLYAESDSEVVTLGNTMAPSAGWTEESQVSSYAEWRDIDLTERENGEVAALSVNIADASDSTEVSVSFDGGEWVKAYESNGTYTVNVPLKKYKKATLKAVTQGQILRISVKYIKL